MASNESEQRLRELDQRTNAGMRITLAWDPGDDRVLLTVDDLVTGDYLEVEVHPGSARYAYEHPFAYLASVPNASTGYCPVAA